MMNVTADDTWTWQAIDDVVARGCENGTLLRIEWPMTEEPAETEQPDSELDMDVRSVAVIWSGDNIDLSFEGCSPFEAIGLLHVGLRKLEAEFALDGDEDDAE